MIFSTVIPFLVYWLLIFVVNFVVVEYGQNYLYDEATPKFGLKVMAGSFILAALATLLRPGFDTMFTNNFHWTALQALAWVGVFTLLYQFHPPHALLIGLTAMVIVLGLATMTAESLTRPRHTLAPTNTRNTGPVRKAITLPPAARPDPK